MLFSTPAFAQDGEHAGEHAEGGEHAAGAAHEGAAHERAAHEAVEGGAEHHEGPDWSALGMQGVNLIVFVAILVIFGRRPIADALHNRANNVRRQLDEAARLRDEAEARYADIEKKLAGLDQRIEEMTAQAELDSKAEAARIAERGEADAARIKETAERTIREESARAKNEIRKEAIAQAAVLARDTLVKSVTDNDQERLGRDFLGAIKSGGTSKGDA